MWLRAVGFASRALRQAQGDRNLKVVSLNIVVIDVTLSLSKGTTSGAYLAEPTARSNLHYYRMASWVLL